MRWPQWIPLVKDKPAREKSHGEGEDVGEYGGFGHSSRPLPLSPACYSAWMGVRCDQHLALKWSDLLRCTEYSTRPPGATKLREPRISDIIRVARAIPGRAASKAAPLLCFDPTSGTRAAVRITGTVPQHSVESASRPRRGWSLFRERLRRSRYVVVPFRGCVHTCAPSIHSA